MGSEVMSHTAHALSPSVRGRLLIDTVCRPRCLQYGAAVSGRAGGPVRSARAPMYPPSSSTLPLIAFHMIRHCRTPVAAGKRQAAPLRKIF